MPYKNLADLPDRVKDNLPHHAQEIYMAAYNNAYDQYKDGGKTGDREETAHRVAWSAVKNEYEKNEEGEWVEEE